MTARPTAAVREQAAQLCSMMASCNDPQTNLEWGWGPESAVTLLAYRAFRQAWSSSERTEALWALACSMLRNGEVL